MKIITEFYDDKPNPDFVSLKRKITKYHSDNLLTLNESLVGIRVSVATGNMEICVLESNDTTTFEIECDNSWNNWGYFVVDKIFVP